jgi:hypothetical protein
MNLRDALYRSLRLLFVSEVSRRISQPSRGEITNNDPLSLDRRRRFGAREAAPLMVLTVESWCYRPAHSLQSHFHA